MPDVLTKDDIIYTWTEQATWGSIGGGETVHNRIDMEPEEPDDDLKEREPNRSQRFRMQHYDNVRHDFNGAAPICPIRMPVKLLEMPIVLFLAFQSVSEGASTPFTKTYQLMSTQPDFVASAGYFFRFQRRNLNPSLTRSLSVLDCIARNVHLTWKHGENDQRLFADMPLIQGRGAPNRNLTASGTVNHIAEDFYNFNNIKTFTANGSVLHPWGIDMNFSLIGEPNGVEQNTGKFLTHVIKRVEVACTFDVLWSTAAHDLLLENDDDPPLTRQWILEHGTAGAAGHLKFDLNAIVKKSKEVYIDDVRCIRFNLKTLVGSQGSDTTQPFTVTCTDVVDRNW